MKIDVMGYLKLTLPADINKAVRELSRNDEQAVKYALSPQKTAVTDKFVEDIIEKMKEMAEEEGIAKEDELCIPDSELDKQYEIAREQTLRFNGALTLTQNVRIFKNVEAQQQFVKKMSSKANKNSNLETYKLTLEPDEDIELLLA